MAIRPPLLKTAEGSLEYIRQFKGKHVKYPRDIVLWLPPSYHKKKKKRYPVLYAQDGQNLMDPSTAFLGVDWRLDETLNRLIHTNKMEEIIVIGIYNTPDREQEYTGSRTGHKYAHFVIEELKPLIDSAFRTKPDAKNTGVMGSSLGGLISFCFAWWHPEVFSKAACLSSSFFWNNDLVLNEVMGYFGPKKRLRIYMDVGSKEIYLRPGYRHMTKLLQIKGYRKHKELEFHYAIGASHNEQSWGLRVWRPLQFLFGKKKSNLFRIVTKRGLR